MRFKIPEFDECNVEQKQAGHWGFIEYRPPKKKTEHRPNIDHTALYRPNVDRKSSLKSAHLQYLLLSPAFGTQFSEIMEAAE